MSTELRGPEKLDLLADMLFGDSDPSEIYAEESPMKFESEDGIDKLIIKMPFVKKDDVEMFRGDNDVLIIQVGGHKKIVTLPLTLRDAEILDAELVNEKLTVRLKRKNVANLDG